MASSGTHTFYPEVNDIIEKAYEMVGISVRSGYDLNQARFALDLIFTDWTNQGINLWKLEKETIALTQDSATITLNSRVVDIIDATISDSAQSPVQDLTADRITMSEYLRRPVKTSSGRPVQYAIERNAAAHTVYVWPVPDTSTYSLLAWTMSYIEDTGNYDATPDVPKRFIPALIAGLAAHLCYYNRATLMEAGLPYEAWSALRREIKADYLELFESAKEEDRERASFWINPSIR
jgi:hypothetical protein